MTLSLFLLIEMEYLGELCNILLFTLIFLTRARKLIEHLTSALTVRASIDIFEMIKQIEI